MGGLGAISFAAPWMLAALVALPLIWWLLRALPPAPQRVRFPALIFLFGLKPDEETPIRTPLWLLLLRMAVAALIIIGLAGPLLNARPPQAGTGPLVVAIDDGWTSASNWTRLRAAALDQLDAAGQAGRPIILIRTAEREGQSFAAQTAAAAARQVAALEPSPWRPDRAAVLAAWADGGLMPPRAQSVFFSDGLDHGADDGFAEALSRLGDLSIFKPAPAEMALALAPAISEADALSVPVLRAGAQGGDRLSITAYGDQAHVIARGTLEMKPGEAQVQLRLPLPQEARNNLRRIAIDGEASAGAVTLLDDRWRRISVGLVSGGDAETAQPLLSDLYYLEKALAPHATLRKGTVSDLLASPLSALIVADIGQLIGEDYNRIAAFVEGGGLLIRFAGPRMAVKTDDLVPVLLRRGGRAIGGAMSWAEPQTLGAFDEASPFRGLTVPDDVTITRQVLAEPGLEVNRRTWARLVDGTPLVTAAERGKGRIVLFHVTANTDWSDLPLSGLFVEMLRRTLAYAGPGGALPAGAQIQHLAPVLTLNGQGSLVPPPGRATPIDPALIDEATAGPEHPPGYYGTETSSLALNTVKAGEVLEAVAHWPASAAVSVYSDSPVRKLGPWILLSALLMALADGVAALWLAGKLRWRRLGPQAAGFGAAMLIAALGGLAPDASRADDAALMAAANDTRLAFIESGDAQVDTMTLAGLRGLSRYISAKTALDPGEPIGLDIERDELTLYPLIYWPMTPGRAAPSADALAKLDRYLRTGGMVLFDTRDQDVKAASLGGVTANEASLRAILGGLDIPPLEPVPENHVLRRSFYLLDEFPGRLAGGEVWVEAAADGEALAGTTNDGVSTIIIGAHDWAAAWATDAQGRPLAPAVPGGEHQRKLAYRFGINVAMYALTGNYKGDLVHTRALIERLGE